MFRYLLLIFLGIMSSSAVLAQVNTIRGSVVDADGGGLPGVNITIKGSALGTITDIDGKYSLAVSDQDQILLFSFIGYKSQEIAVAGRTQIDVTLQEDIQQLNEVVVTALGIEKDKASLGYSSQQVSGEDLTTARESNVINSLSGKISGVQINNSGTGQSGSSKVTIRGLASIAGNNSPLFVVDGVPVDNTSGGGSEFGGVDYGSAISSINPDDIASINVLKGASASALYGSRGQNGVIMITTRKGAKRSGIGVTFNTNYTAETPLVTPEFQNEYGRGSGGNFPFFTQGPNRGKLNNNIIGSWGQKMEGQTAFDIGGTSYPILSWTGEELPYNAQPDNYNDFWQTGSTFTNSLTFSGGNEKTTVWASISQLENESIMPNSGFSRTSANLRLTNKFGERLSIDGKFTYVYQENTNRPNLTLSPDNPVKSLIEMPRNIRLSDLQNYIDANDRPRVFTNATSLDQWQNPYWAVNLNTNNDQRDRMTGFLKLDYKIFDWLSAFVRVGTDVYFDERERRIAPNTIYKIDDEYLRYEGRVQENNLDILITANKDWNESFNSVLSVGGNLMHQKRNGKSTTALGLEIPYYYDFTNASDLAISPFYFEKEIQSLYATLDLSYKNYLYLQLTGRNDWSSVLPPENWSYFYPSASLSFVFSDAFDLRSDWFSFGKLRTSYAFVGNDTGPFQLSQLYVVNGLSHGNQKLGQIVGTRPNIELKNELTRSFEVGMELNFFMNRIGLDVTYYNAGTSDQLIPLQVSRPSGYTNAWINSGLIRNQGIELMLNTIPLELGDFRWDLDLNFTLNRNEIIELDKEGLIGVQNLGSFDQFGVQIVAEEGRPFGDIYATKAYKKDETGQRIINSSGLPESSSTPERIGNYLPDWQAGINNTFNYKSFRLSFLLDIQKGGDIYSYSNAVMAGLGNSKASLEGRRLWYAGAGGFVADGVLADGTPNMREVNPEDYWSSVGGSGGGMFAEEFLYDASYVKLRELSVSYNLPSSLLDKTPFAGASLSLVGRNLAILYSNTPGFDPEATFNSGNAQGIEAFAFPSTRSYGVNLNVKF